jgi:serine/threonine-protein phosphatase 5
MTMKEHKLREFAKCIGYDDKKIEVDVEHMVVEDSYTGPKLENGIEELNAEWVEKLIEYLKDGKVLHKKYATLIILKARDLFEKDQSLVHITVPTDKEVTVCGDIHGQFYDLVNIFKINGSPS